MKKQYFNKNYKIRNGGSKGSPDKNCYVKEWKKSRVVVSIVMKML